MAKKGKHITHEDRKNNALRITVWENSINESLKKSNLKGASFENKIRRIAACPDKRTAWFDTVNREIINAFYRFNTKNERIKRNVFRELLLHLDKKNCSKILDHDACLIGLYHIATYQSKFIREISTWQKTSHNPFKQFSSLLRHLFCAYTVPTFLDSAWFSLENKHQRNWLTALGVGISIRKLNYIPINMTKKVAHAFGHAPANLTVSEALRWAQVIGKGGDDRLADFLIRSRIGRNDFQDEEFWDGAIQFFINAGLFDYEKIEEMVDYLLAQRAITSQYSLKGRTVASIIRASNLWHNDQEAARQRGGRLIWTSSDIKEAFYKEGKNEKEVAYSILELRSTKELAQEGKKMNHCVATYASSCYRKRSAIFSIRKKDILDQEETLATVEVSLQGKRIVQAKARYNRPINHKALLLMKNWATKENLQIPNWILTQ